MNHDSKDIKQDPKPKSKKRSLEKSKEKEHDIEMDRETSKSKQEKEKPKQKPPPNIKNPNVDEKQKHVFQWPAQSKELYQHLKEYGFAVAYVKPLFS